MNSEEIAANLAGVNERIVRAAERAGRDPETITLVAVTKTFSRDTVLAGIRAGLRHFGENRAEELEQKRPQIEAQVGNEVNIMWHLIGPLQSRKTAAAADCADIFHALDRLKIARRLSNRLIETRKKLPVFLEVNVSGEETKHGFECSRWEEETSQRETLLKVAKQIGMLPGLAPLGLMTMAPWQAEEKVVRDTFARTRRLAEWLQEQLQDAGWTKLSMGMTDDFEIAIEEGATHLRIGRAIFGERHH